MCCHEGVYCCFTRTTLFTTMFTVIVVVCSLKSMCIPRFVLIGCCVSELHAYLYPYRNVCPDAVFTRTAFCTKILTRHCNGHYGFLSVCKVSFLDSVRFLIYGG